MEKIPRKTQFLRASVCFFLASTVLSLLNQNLTFAAPTPGVANPKSSPSGAILQDPRTATELPTKRKLPTDQTVEVKRKETDRQIQTRLTRIAKSQDIFQKVEVSVVEGIVTLKGEVEEEAYAKSFSALSERVEGVIGVVDTLKITNEKKTGLRLAQSEVDDLIHKFFKFIPYLISCFLILIVTVTLGYGVFRFWKALLKRKLTHRPLLVPHLSKILAAPVYMLGAYLILQVGGAAGLAATLVGGTGVLGIILGLAGKNILEDLLSSFMLTLRNPFKIGDDVTIGEQSGIVYRIDSRCTMLLNYDGIFVQIPNSTVLGAIIKNISAHPVNRVIFPLYIKTELGFSSFKKIFENTLSLNAKAILPDPKPRLTLTSWDDQHMTLQCSFWVDTQTTSAVDTKSNVMHSLLHFLKSDNQSLADVEESIETSEKEPTEKKVLEDRTSTIRAPSGS